MGRTIFNDVRLPPGVRQADLDDASVSRRKRAGEHAEAGLENAIAELHQTMEFLGDGTPRNTRICDELEVLADRIFDLKKQLRPALDVMA